VDHPAYALQGDLGVDGREIVRVRPSLHLDDVPIMGRIHCSADRRVLLALANRECGHSASILA